MADQNTTGAVSRRNVLKTTGGLLTGATVLTELGAGRGAAETEKGLHIEIREANEEYIAVNVRLPEEINERTFNSTGYGVFLGHVDRFIIHEDEEAVSLPEDTEGLVAPVHTEAMGGGETNWMMYFRTEGLAWPKEYEREEVTLGLGVFPESTMPIQYWDAEPVPFPCC